MGSKMNWLDLKPINNTDILINLDNILNISLEGLTISIENIVDNIRIGFDTHVEAKIAYEKIKRGCENYGPIPRQGDW